MYQDRLQLLGHKHHNTLNSQERLADCLKRLGRLEGAEILQRQVCEIMGRVYGEDDLDGTVDSKENLAIILNSMRRDQEAEVLQREVWATRQRLLGENDLDTVEAEDWLVHFLDRVGKVEEAEELQRHIWATRRRVYGRDNRETIGSQFYLSLFLFDLGRCKEAEVFQRQTWETRRRLLGERHEDTMDSMSWLALMLRDLDKYEEAEALHRQTWEARQELLGKGHKKTLQSLFALTYDVVSLTRYDDALKLVQTLESDLANATEREIWEKFEGVATYASARCLFEIGKDEEAEVAFREALRNERVKADSVHVQFGRIYLEVLTKHTAALDQSLAWLNSAFEKHDMYHMGRRLLAILEQWSKVREGDTAPEIENSSSIEVLSFFTCPDSTSFMQACLDADGSSIATVKTEINTIEKVRASNKPHQTGF